nr:immunoglobulin heavy chain junction region [Macaca mulatta]MOV41670.1 immunoglobulin heavy chain junction region [Macaca mulatta]MOV42684.1 immunoglobulin heavy chain junction region [Macaca mulatta]
CAKARPSWGGNYGARGLDSW